MFNSRTNENVDLFPGWTTFQLADRQAGRMQEVEIFMDRYLIILTQDPEEKGGSFLRTVDLPTNLLAFDLWNNTTQEVKLDASLFHLMNASTYTKYKDNQIIKFGGRDNKMIRITIESFQPLLAKCEELQVKGEKPFFSGHTAQIYNDSLYVYGEIPSDNEENTKRGVWGFDLNTLSWKECGSSDEEPDVPIHQPRSFIIQDSLYIYAGDWKRDTMFIFNLSSMEWTEVERTRKGLKGLSEEAFGQAIYKDHLLVIKNNSNDGMFSKRKVLCCWNIKTNSWSTFDIQQPGNSENDWARNFAIYKNLLVVPKLDRLESRPNSRLPFVCFMNLDNFGFSSAESPEQQQLRSLFMSQEGSDINLKVQDKIIPAHKRVLIEKSEYFANLFGSGMAESKQKVIEIPDCEYCTFQEFLRFLYYDEIKKDADLAMKLFVFADKYVQNRLREKCVDFLQSNISSDNVYRILDFARQEKIAPLKDWCLRFLKDKINPSNISGLVEYLNSPKNPEFAQENLELRDKAINVITNKYLEISKDQKTPQFYEDFLTKNITCDTALPLVNFISGQNHNRVIKFGLYGESDKERLIEEEKEKLKPHTIGLRAALYSFIQRNLTTLTENQTAKQLPNSFLVDLIRKMTETQEKHRRNLHGEEQTSQ